MRTDAKRERERMVKYQRGLFVLAAAVAFLAEALMVGEVEAGSLNGESGLGWAAAWSACKGTIAECLGGEEAEEMAMDSESHRRILQAGQAHKSIVKRVLTKDEVPCRNQGVPYVNNCKEGAIYQNHAKGRLCNVVHWCDREQNSPP